MASQHRSEPTTTKTTPIQKLEFSSAPIQKVAKTQESTGARFHQRHYTYRYLFDPKKTFERSSIIDRDTRTRYNQQESSASNGKESK